MPMDPQLAALYGTDEETDTEKLAAAELAEELSEEETFDPETATEEQVEALAEQFLAEEGEEGAEMEAQGEEEGAEMEEPSEEDEEQVKMSADQEAQEKLAEADYLGRVMAHAYVQELRGIEGEELAKEASLKGKLMRGAVHVRRAGRKVKNYVTSKGHADIGPNKGRTLKGDYNRAKEHVRSHGKAYGGAALAAGAAAGGAYAYKKRKQSSAEGEPTALDLLAERRALEILEANGIELEAPAVEKTSASQEEMELLAAAVEQRAAELLEANGFQFEDEQAEE